MTTKHKLKHHMMRSHLYACA